MKDDLELNAKLVDEVAQTNATVLGHTPAVSICQTHLAMAQAQSVLFANMVQGQQQQATVSSASTLEGVKNLQDDDDVAEDAADRIVDAIGRMTSALSDMTVHVS